MADGKLSIADDLEVSIFLTASSTSSSFSITGYKICLYDLRFLLVEYQTQSYLLSGLQVGMEMFCSYWGGAS